MPGVCRCFPFRDDPILRDVKELVHCDIREHFQRWLIPVRDGIDGIEMKGALALRIKPVSAVAVLGRLSRYRRCVHFDEEAAFSIRDFQFAFMDKV